LNFSFDETEINGARVVVLTIPAAKVVPTAFNRDRFIRIGSSKENLRKYPEKESWLFEVLRHGHPTIENTASDYQKLTFEKLLIYYGAKGLKLNPETFKKNLELFTEDGAYNLLAQLLADDSHMPLRVAIFSGKTKADQLYSIREFGNQCLLYSLDEVLRYGDVLNIIQANENGRVVERNEVPLFDGNAFREAVVNAFVHNAWVTKNEPMITVFSDRIEILSRGLLPPEQTVEGFFAGESVPVNRKLSEIFLQLHISEKTGRGVPLITSIYGRQAYEFRENSIVVTIPFNWLKENAPAPVKESASAPRLSPSQHKILAALRNNPNMTTGQLAVALKLSTSTIDNGLRALKEHNLIERVGSRKGGWWRVLS
ncbi:MAG: MarR family transcriptional regulator, partial [Pyramidobacter sp.]|nr:MarR family transcriptional regulator [Pyramidobacter sp.]